MVEFNPASLLGVLAAVSHIGTAAEVERAAERLRGRLEDRLRTLHQLVAGRDRPRVAVVEWPDPLVAAGLWVPDVVEAGGGMNVLGASGRSPHPANEQELDAAQPDVVILGFRGQSLYETQARLRPLARHRGWLKMSQPARLVAIDARAFLSRPGPRLIEGANLIGWALHRVHASSQPQTGRIAELIEAGWVDLASVLPRVEEKS